MTDNLYGHTGAAAINTCTCGRVFKSQRGLHSHVVHARRAEAAKAEAKEAGIRAEMRSRVAAANLASVRDGDVVQPAPVLVAEKDYRESLTFDDGELWRAVNKTFMASGLLVLVSVESAMDETGHVTHTMHSKDEPAVWDMAEFELWAFFRSIVERDLLDLDGLVKRYAGTEIGLNIVATMMFLFFAPKEGHK
jgi:hypothetical protein